MMGRVRKPSRRNWPANLYAHRDGFKYRHPITKRDHPMGKDKEKAFAAAKRLNALLLVGGDLVGKVIRARDTVTDAIKIFRQDDIPERGWAPKTAEVYESVIRRIEKGLGEVPCAELSVKTCATFIRGVTDSPRARQQFRLVLGWILACAVQEGWLETNPALSTRKFAAPRQRQRLTIEQYRAIWQKAEPALRNAMDLSLLTLLRRDDVANARFSDVHDGALWIMPGKTEHSTGVRLKIPVTGDLPALLARCRDNVASPYLVHRLPKKARPMHMRAEEREHHTQVLPDQVSRLFAKARDAAEITGNNPPTFHEIRSLGGALLRQAGWTVDQIQELMGHSATAMTEHYLDGHEQPWQEVSTGISLPG